MHTCQINSYSIEHLHGDSQEGQEFAIYSLEEIKAHFNKLHKPHRHDYYTLLLNEQGRGKHEIDFDNYAILDRQVYFISPEQIHVWKEVQALKGYLIGFKSDFFELRYHHNMLQAFPFFQNQFDLPFLNLNRDQATHLSRLLKMMYAEYHDQNQYREAIIRSYLNILLCEMARLYFPQHRRQDRPHRLFRQFEHLISQHYLEKKKVREYADALSISPNYLNEITNQVSGQSAGELIRRRVMLEAKRLLAHTQSSVSEVAYQLGFEDVSYFCRFFKKYAHYTPENFREQYP